MATDFSTFSIRKAASAVGVSPTLVYHILHDDLHVKPYKNQEWLKLEEYYYEKRLKFPPPIVPFTAPKCQVYLDLLRQSLFLLHIAFRVIRVH